MDGLSNSPAVVNGGANVYDRAICFDAPVQMDTGLYAYESKTRAQVRTALIAALGFLDPLTYTGTRTLAELRADLATRLGFGAQVAAGSYPQGMLPLLDSFINEAQQTIFRRLELDNGAVSPPDRMAAVGDVTTIDYVPVFNHALGLAKAHYGQADAKVYLQMMEQYIVDVARRRPPMLTSTLNELIRSAQENLYFRYSMLRTERWWAWQTTAGRAMYDVPIDCTKALDFRKITGAYISDNGGRTLTYWAGQLELTAGQFLVPPIANGFEYEVTVSGTGGPLNPETGLSYEPNWSLVLDEEVILGGGGATIATRAAATSRVLPLRQGYSPTETNVPNHAMPWAFDLREYLELWPVPDKTYVVWLKGHLGIRRMETDDDTLTVDFEPVFLMALANAKEHFKQPAISYWRQLEVLIGKYTAASHGIRKYIPNPRPMTETSLVYGDIPPPLPRATFRP